MSSPLSDVLGLIERAPSRHPFLLMGIGGHGGAGKSTLARAIARALADGGPAVQIVATDSFWSGTQFDLSRLRHQVLDVLLTGVCATYEEWDWSAAQMAGPRIIEPTGVVIVEGVCALHQMFRDDLDVRIWVDAPYDDRLARGVARDGEDKRSTWTDIWMPSEDSYVARDNPQACAHLIVDGTKPL